MSISVGVPVVPLPEQAADPAAVAQQALVYAKDVAAVSQVFARSDDGTVHQLTPVSAGGSPGAPLNAVQFNSPLGTFAGNAALTFDGTTFAFTATTFDLDPTGDYRLDMDADSLVRVVLGANSGAPFFGYQMLFPGAIDNVMHVRTLAGFERIEFGPQALGAHQVVINMGNATAGAFTLQRGSGGNDFIDVNTTTSTITLGNTGDNGPTVFLGTGDVRLTAGPLVFVERAADPGGTGNQGKLYTKDVATITELFYQRSDGTVVQLS